MTCNIKQLPVIIITQVIWRYQKAQCAGLKAGKLVPIRIFICIKYIAAGGYRNRSIAANSYCALVKGCSAANGNAVSGFCPRFLKVCAFAVCTVRLVSSSISKIIRTGFHDLKIFLCNGTFNFSEYFR